MPTPLPDYYAVLELNPTATQAEVKRRYRELARQYHPDVNPSPDAAQKIKSVNEAHRVLGDPDRRSQYDAERTLFSSQSAAKSPGSNGRSTAGQHQSNRANSRQGGTPNSSPVRTARPGPRVEFNGFGRASPGETAPHSTEVPRQPTPAKPAASDVAAAAGRLVSEAQVAFLTRNYTNAEQLARDALTKDRSTAAAHEVLGDVYAVRGETEAAIKSYSYAIQFNPRSYSAQGKLDRLIGRRPLSAPGPMINRKAAGATYKPLRPGVSREAVLALISVALFVSGCAVLAFYGMYPGVPLGSAVPWITLLSPNLIIALAIEGVIGGMLLAFYGKVWPISETLGTGGRLDRKAPLGVILTLFSLVWFYASLIVYLAVAVGRDRLSASTVRVYGLVLVLVALFTVMAAVSDRSGWLETAAFAGNILFPGSLLGWYLGDCVRLRGQ